MERLLSKDKKILVLVALTEIEVEILELQFNYVPSFFSLWKKNKEKKLPDDKLSLALIKKYNPQGIGIMRYEEGFKTNDEIIKEFKKKLNEEKEEIKEQKENEILKELL